MVMRTSGSKQIDDVLDGCVGAAVSGFGRGFLFAHSDDATRRDAGELVRPGVVVRQRFTICPGRPAGDVPLPSAGGLSCGLPSPIVCHRPFDREHAAVVVSDDKEEWGSGLVGHAATLPRQEK